MSEIKSNKISLGFTIVELLIVIVVIAILASITVVAFNGIQARAKDTSIRTSMNQLEKSILIWHTNTGMLPISGWGSTVAVSGGACSDGSGGWMYAGAYACSLEDVLVSAQLIPTGFTRKLPANTSYGNNAEGLHTVMFYRCGSTNRFALYWYLYNPTAQDAASLAAAEAKGCPTGPRVNYSMRAAKVFEF